VGLNFFGFSFVERIKLVGTVKKTTLYKFGWDGLDSCGSQIFFGFSFVYRV